MTQTTVVSKETPIDGYCESGWGRNKCPNKAEYVLKNTTNDGYAIMCSQHKDGFFNAFPKAETKAIAVNSIDEIQSVINNT